MRKNGKYYAQRPQRHHACFVVQLLPRYRVRAHCVTVRIVCVGDDAMPRGCNTHGCWGIRRTQWPAVAAGQRLQQQMETCPNFKMSRVRIHPWSHPPLPCPLVTRYRLCPARHHCNAGSVGAAAQEPSTAVSTLWNLSPLYVSSWMYELVWCVSL